KRDLLRPTAHALAQRTRRLDAEVARRGGKEDEADEIGAGLERHVERLRRLQAADFDQNGHGAGPSRARFYIGADVLSRLPSSLRSKEKIARLGGGRRDHQPRGGVARRWVDDLHVRAQAPLEAVDFRAQLARLRVRVPRGATPFALPE